MEGYTDYFDGWINCKDENYKTLQEMFITADKGFGQRIEIQQNGMTEEQSKLQNLIQHYFDENLAKIEENWKKAYSEGELRKMACLTKGNILLRKGQYLGERFFASQEYYQQACIVLEQCYMPNETEFLDLMIQLNLGKYFRNMGKHNQRSDYRRALDEFKDIQKKIGEYPVPGSWEEHIRLEAMVNIGRTHRHLYQLKNAKKTLLDTIAEIILHSGKEIEINDRLDHYIKIEKERREQAEKNSRNEQESGIRIDEKENEKKEQTGKEDSLYEYYLVQALVQLSIVFQKSREYETAFDICVTILNRDPENVDAANNLAVCLRKMDKKISARELIAEKQKENEKKDEGQEEQQENANAKQDDPQYLNKCYKDIFDYLRRKNNRFAKLHSIKCDIDELDMNSDKVKTDIDMLIEKGRKIEKIKTDIDGLLKTNPDDQEVLLLEGLYYQKTGEFEKSQEVFGKLYSQSHQLAKGTIGLKAYYNMADNMLRQNKHHEARKYYERIVEEFQKVDSADDKIDSKDLETWNDVLTIPPESDVLAEIALGWCLMNLGDYEGAEKCYKNLLESYKDMPDRIRTENQMRIKNNLAECLLYLAACPEKNASKTMAEKRLQDAHTYLAEICYKEPNNATTNRHLGYYHILVAQKEKDARFSEKELEEALDHFKRAELYNMEDVYVHAGWVSAAVQPLSGKDSYEKGCGQHINNRLKYSSGIYSIKACAKLAEYIVQLEKNNSGETDADDLKTMYRSLARIRLSDKEEGYGMFQRFKENEIFRRLKAEKRGELLVGLFRLYEQIIKIKDICRFVPDVEGKEKEWLPVHYTKIDTLKKLLPGADSSSGKLRLWNTVYMNDTFEGESFIEMMKHAARKKMQHNGTGDKESDIDRRVIEKMKKYFPYLDKTASEGEALVPINENIYVTSFSREENGIYMWIPYGDDAKGCTITFEEDFFDIRKTRDALTDVAAYSDEDYPLYEIQYLSEDDLRESCGEENKISKILHIMDKIWEILDDLEKCLEDKAVLETITDKKENGKKEKDQKEKALVRGFIADCLNEVRFLIKSSEYSFEKEVRMLHYSYEPKMETENYDIPRLYVDVDRDIRIKEIKLGPKISEFETNELVSWLSKTGKVGCITKSGRHYN